jgi:hypothetical protein
VTRTRNPDSKNKGLGKAPEVFETSEVFGTRRMRSGILGISRLAVFRTAFVAYWGFVTFLLLTPEPLEVLGLHEYAETLAGGYGRHFFLFAGLGLLGSLGRWPISTTMLGCLLGAYGVATEVVQAFVPRRTPELADVVEDLLGVAAGLAIGAAVAWLGRKSGRKPGRVLDSR